jgi:hypothetical protein
VSAGQAIELGRIMGTSLRMIEMHDGALLDTAQESMLERLEAAAIMCDGSPDATDETPTEARAQ